MGFVPPSQALDHGHHGEPLPDLADAPGTPTRTGGLPPRDGRVPGRGNTLQAPHIALAIMGPGFLKRLVTRVYFADARENADDPILGLVPEERRTTLIAVKEPGATNLYRFDIHLGGPRETVFFDI